MKFFAIFCAILLRESITISTDDNSWCFKLDKNGTKLLWFCSYASESFDKTCSNSSQFSTNECASIPFIELKMSGCDQHDVASLVNFESVDTLEILEITYITNVGSNDSVDWWLLHLPSDNKFVNISIPHNGLTEIPNAFQYETPNIEFFDLSHNKLNDFSLRALKSFNELVEIRLQHNQLINLRSEFAHLTKLEFLDLSNNHIWSGDNIVRPSSLKVLLLENNPGSIGSGDVHGATEKSECFKIDKNDTKFQVFCSNAQTIFNETCFVSTQSKVMQAINSSAITELKISGCEINRLPFVLKELKNVENVDISYGSDNSFDFSYFYIPKVDKITKINISHNGLTKIPASIGKNLYNLKIIDLSFNELNEIQSSSFENAWKLVEIHLQHNHLMKLQYEFARFRNLEYLDLRNNRLQSIYDINLSTSLKTLRLENNPLGKFPCGSPKSKQWIHLANVYVSWQRIEILNIECIEERMQLVISGEEFVAVRDEKFFMHCGHQSLTKLKQIIARSDRMNDLHEFVYVAGPTLRSLEILDLNGANQLAQFDLEHWRAMGSLKEINIRNGGLKKVKHAFLLQFVSLRCFDASWNQIENVHEIIENLNPLIETLRLSGNFIGEINGDIFKKLTNLKELKLSRTKMIIVGSSPFDHLEKLENLDISYNDLSNVKVPIVSPSTISKLKQFNATNCRIRNANEIMDSFGPSIEEIKLSGNFIGELTAQTLNRMQKLELLFLNNTNLSICNSKPFDRLDKLSELDFSHNDLSGVNFTNLSPALWELVEFSAVNCKIKNAQDLVNALGKYIMDIDLSENPIGMVHFNLFNKFQLFNSLKLRNTGLQLFDSEVIVAADGFFELDISFNDLSDFDFTQLSPILNGLFRFKAVGCQIRNADAVLEQFRVIMENLDLSENPIEKMNFERFKELPYIEKLQLSKTNLKSFDFSVFEENEEFQLLNISFNHLGQLNISLPLLHLETLDVRGNELREIHNFNRQRLPQLRSLGISGNHFDCEYLEQLNDEWTDLVFINDEWNQKDWKCYKPTQKPEQIISITFSSLANEIQTKGLKIELLHIFQFVTIAALVILITFIVCRYIIRPKWCRKNKKSELIVQFAANPVVAPNECVDNHIYQEIAERPPVRYNRLVFGPPPLTEYQDHYENAPDTPEIVSIDSMDSVERLDRIGLRVFF